MFENIREDMRRYQQFGGWYRHLGFWLTLAYRFGHWSSNIRLRLPRLLCLVVYRLIRIPLMLFSDTAIPRLTEIGSGLSLLHPHGIVITPSCKIGSNCSIFHQVTLGTGEQPGSPHIENHVVVFAGAKVLGPVHLGKYVHVGANAVVLKDVPERHTAVGVPARIIDRNWQY